MQDRPYRHRTQASVSVSRHALRAVAPRTFLSYAQPGWHMISSPSGSAENSGPAIGWSELLFRRIVKKPALGTRMSLPAFAKGDLSVQIERRVAPPQRHRAKLELVRDAIRNLPATRAWHEPAPHRRRDCVRLDHALAPQPPAPRRPGQNGGATVRTRTERGRHERQRRTARERDTTLL